jgi:hypothetical protein
VLEHALMTVSGGHQPRSCRDFILGRSADKFALAHAALGGVRAGQ